MTFAQLLDDLRSEGRCDCAGERAGEALAIMLQAYGSLHLPGVQPHSIIDRALALRNALRDAELVGGPAGLLGVESDPDVVAAAQGKASEA